ncbi:hypothetical protein IMY05_C4467000200 [Salix suchowensis]|nr:hypothetical protein IMY05_C4467000200 [Salix suchowensis]
MELGHREDSKGGRDRVVNTRPSDSIYFQSFTLGSFYCHAHCTRHNARPRGARSPHLSRSCRAGGEQVLHRARAVLRQRRAPHPAPCQQPPARAGALRAGGGSRGGLDGQRRYQVQPDPAFQQRLLYTTTMSANVTFDPLAGHLHHLTAEQIEAFIEFKDNLALAELYTHASEPESPKASHDDPTLLCVDKPPRGRDLGILSANAHGHGRAGGSTVSAAWIAIICVQARGGGAIAEGTGCGPPARRYQRMSVRGAQPFRRAFTVMRPLSQRRPLRVHVQFCAPAVLASAARERTDAGVVCDDDHRSEGRGADVDVVPPQPPTRGLAPRDGELSRDTALHRRRQLARVLPDYLGLDQGLVRREHEEQDTCLGTGSGANTV